MQTVLYVLCALLWIAGAGLFLMGTTVLLQIVGAIIGLSGMVAFAGGAIVGALDDLANTLKNSPKQGQ